MKKSRVNRVSQDAHAAASPVAGERLELSASAEGAARRVRVSALLLIVGLAAPAGEHLYWVLGGTWGLHKSVDGHIQESTTTGIRVVAAIVVVLLVAAAFVILARVGLWQQAFVSSRMIQVLAWAVAAVFLAEALASFTYSREYEWWMYGPVALVLAVLSLVVAGSGGAWPRFHRPHRTLPTH